MDPLIDFDKELDKLIYGDVVTRPADEPDRCYLNGVPVHDWQRQVHKFTAHQIRDIAKHFFDLGRRNEKCENVMKKIQEI